MAGNAVGLEFKQAAPIGAALSPNRAGVKMAKKDIKQMSDDDLIDELRTQEEWAKDDYFEFIVSNRGDGERKRDAFIAKLYEEVQRRGLLN